MKLITQTLQKGSDLIRQNRFEELETEGLKIKPVPASGGDWLERHKSINAFLNTHGRILILGIKEEGTGPNRRYIFQEQGAGISIRTSTPCDALNCNNSQENGCLCS